VERAQALEQEYTGEAFQYADEQEGATNEEGPRDTAVDVQPDGADDSGASND
jgi:hypothetical protein